MGRGWGAGTVLGHADLRDFVAISFRTRNLQWKKGETIWSIIWLISKKGAMRGPRGFQPLSGCGGMRGERHMCLCAYDSQVGDLHSLFGNESFTFVSLGL